MSDESDKSNKLWSESGSDGLFITGLGGLLSCREFHLGATLYADESCDGDGGSIFIPYKNVGEAGTGGDVCTKCIGDVNIFSIEQISSESSINKMFFELFRMGWFELVWLISTWIKSEYLLSQIKEFLRPTLSTSKLFLRSVFMKMLLYLRFYARFSISLFIVPDHVNTL